MVGLEYNNFILSNEFVDALVCSGCPDNAPQTRGQGCLNNRNVLSDSSGGWKYDRGVRGTSLPGRPFPAVGHHLLRCPHKVITLCASVPAPPLCI